MCQLGSRNSFAIRATAHGLTSLCTNLHLATTIPSYATCHIGFQIIHLDDLANDCFSLPMFCTAQSICQTWLSFTYTIGIISPRAADQLTPYRFIPECIL
jgi:hypothetical protein